MKKKGTILAACLLAFSLLLSCTACGSWSPSAAEEEQEEDEGILIGMSFDSFVIERWVRDRDVFVSTAESLGASVLVQCANGDVQEQIDQIRYLMDKKVDVLVVIPVDCASLSEVLREAKAAGIRILSYDRLATDAGVDLYVSYDNEAVGRLMGEALVRTVPENGKLFVISGPLTDDNVKKIEQGFYGVIDNSTLNVVYKARCENWNAAEGYKYVKEALEQDRDVGGIMCGNDDIASQAFRVLAEERLAGRVMLTGQDGDLSACQRVVTGTQLMTVFKSMDEEARAAARYAVRLAQGDPIDDVDKTISDGSQDVPYLELVPIAVTAENMDEVIIEGGFHARDEVYRRQ